MPQFTWFGRFGDRVTGCMVAMQVLTPGHGAMADVRTLVVVDALAGECGPEVVARGREITSTYRQGGTARELSLDVFGPSRGIWRCRAAFLGFEIDVRRL